MVQVTDRLRSVLDQHQVPYEVVRHARDYTAQRAAQDTHTPGMEFAKVVFVRADGRFVMAVLPAHHRVNLGEMRQALRARDVRLATEDETRRLCPDAEVGAAPPFGMLFDVPVYVSSWMTGDEKITFNAGSHEEAMRINFSDYMKIVQPEVIDFSTSH